MIAELSRNNIDFPPVEDAINGSNMHGLLAIGGDLSVERLCNAYKSGIFPWYSDLPIQWHSPDPRFVLYTEQLHIPKSLKKTIKKNKFTITIDNDFEYVIKQCAEARFYTWITDEMIEAYTNLHKEGLAHSVEAWYDGQIVGGLYGVSFGRIFFGESMFSYSPDASKIAFVKIVEILKNKGFDLIDSQVYTEHIARFGGIDISRDQYIKELNKALQYETLQYSWENFITENNKL